MFYLCSYDRAQTPPDLAADPRFLTNALRVQNRDALVPLLESLLRQLSTAQWQERLLAAEVPHAPVWSYAELFSHSQAQTRGLRVTVRDPQGRPVDLIGSPFHIAGTALPQHARCVRGNEPLLPPHNPAA